MFKIETTDIDNKIKNELYTLILDYINKNKQIDFYFIRDVIDIFISYKKLQDFYESFVIDNKIKELGRHNAYEKIIKLNFKKIYQKAKENSNLFNEDDYRIYCHIEILKTLLHELEHVDQEKKKKENKTLEDRILIESYKRRDKTLIFSDQLANDLIDLNFKTLSSLFIEVLKYKHLYDKYYNLDPSERLANIISISMCADICELLEKENIYDFFKLRLYCDLLVAYNQKSIPTKYYIEKLNKDFTFWEQIELQSKCLNSNKRASLGLELSNDEFNELVDEMALFSSKIKKLM